MKRKLPEYAFAGRLLNDPAARFLRTIWEAVQDGDLTVTPAGWDEFVRQYCKAAEHLKGMRAEDEDHD